MDARIKIAEGKTKVVSSYTPREGCHPQVIIKSKDDITAGDGAKRDVLANKGELSTTTTVNCFELLKRAGVGTHFVRRLGPNSFLAYRATMFPVEVVVRRVATGSYLKRNPHIEEGTDLSYLVEFFLKDDKAHDPLMIIDFVSDRTLLFSAKKPLMEGFIGENHILPVFKERLRLEHIKKEAVNAFKVLERAWADQGVKLVDFKVEFGHLEGQGLLPVIADVIDNDSWRLWPGGRKENQVDKQIYRDIAGQATFEDLSKLVKSYTWVAEQTGRFLRLR